MPDQGEIDSREPAARQAYRSLERMIVMLELMPGTISTEGALIERVGLGRTPVREALQRLAWERLIEIRPRAGIAIAPLHVSDWLRVIEVRAGLERVLARSAALHAGGRFAQMMQDACGQMRRAAVTGDLRSFLAADKLIDEAVSISADHPYAAQAVSPLQVHSRRFWFRYQRASMLTRSADLHVGLIAAILDGDARSAQKRSRDMTSMLRQFAKTALTR